MENKRVGIIGHFGGTKNFLDGQTIKTKVLYDELKKETNWGIIKVDTYLKSRRPLRLLAESVACLLHTKDVIVLLSGNGMRIYFPMLYFFSKIFHVRVYHDVIGGNLNRYIEKYPTYRMYLNAFAVNWVETSRLKTGLEELGIMNCEVLPNFKRLKVVEQVRSEFGEPYRLCTFSRVMKEKGIEDAVRAVEQINQENGRTVCELDIYGDVDLHYRERFQKIMHRVTAAVRYMGTVPYDQSVNALRNYDALLFPTYWDGEGFPGTIIDAFSAGVPVIATDWNCNGEIVADGKTGILYSNQSERTLKEAIERLLGNKEECVKMRRECMMTAKCYQPDTYIEKIIKRIEM